MSICETVIKERLIKAAFHDTDIDTDTSREDVGDSVSWNAASTGDIERASLRLGAAFENSAAG